MQRLRSSTIDSSSTSAMRSPLTRKLSDGSDVDLQVIRREKILERKYGAGSNEKLLNGPALCTKLEYTGIQLQLGRKHKDEPQEKLLGLESLSVEPQRRRYNMGSTNELSLELNHNRARSRSRIDSTSGLSSLDGNTMLDPLSRS